MLELQRAQVQTSHEIRSNIFFLWNWEGGGMEIQFIWNQIFWKTLSFLSFYKIYLYIFHKYMLTRIDPGKNNIVFFLFFGNCLKKKNVSPVNLNSLAKRARRARGPRSSHTWPWPLCCARRLTQNRKHGFSPRTGFARKQRGFSPCEQELSLVCVCFLREWGFFSRTMLINLFWRVFVRVSLGGFCVGINETEPQ